MSTDADWETWGKENPYFGVRSNPQFIGNELPTPVSDEFFASGVSDVTLMMNCLRQLSQGKPIAIKNAVDFGCGVGRLSIPLSAHAEKVTGVDVSPSMIARAQRDIPADKKGRVSFVLCDDNMRTLPQKYDLVYSYIVLQHIPVKRGERIIEKLLHNLQVGGHAALHLTFRHQGWIVERVAKKIAEKVRARFKPLHFILNALKGQPMSTPLMRMHLYNLARVYELFYAAGIRQTIQVMTNHGGFVGALIVGQKN